MLLIETAINRYLSLDPEMRDKLAAFEGKVIKIEITGTRFNLYMFPGAHGVSVSMQNDGEVDTVIKGSAIALFKMGLVKNAADMLLTGEVEIKGDTRLGHQFKNALSQMDIDWAAPLAEVLGDGVAFQAQQTFGDIGRWSRASMDSVAASVSEYLQEESRDVVTETELQIFNSAVDNMRNDVERLQAKINSFNSKDKTN